MTTAPTRPAAPTAVQPQSRIPRPRTTSSNGSAPALARDHAPPPPRSAAARSPSRPRSPATPQQPDQDPPGPRRQSVPIHDNRTRPPPLIERRLSNPADAASSLGSSSNNPNANKRRALSLSIFIPPSPAAPSNRPPVDAAAAAATRGHSRTASRESAASSFASTPRELTAATRSPQRVRQPRTGLDSATGIGRRCSAPVGGGPPSASASPLPFPRPPRTPYPFPRTRLPALERTLSDSTMATYTSFDLQHPKTPDEERDAAAVRDEARWWDPRRWVWWSGSRSRASYPQDEDRDDDERTALLAAQSSLSSSRRLPQEADLENQLAPALGRQTRFQYVWGEVKCYARHMLPPIFVFVVLVLVIALLAYRQGIHRIAHPPKQP